MRAIRCCVAALLAAGIVTMVAAQPGRQGRIGFGQQDTYLLVLTNTALQDEVKATDAQKEAFKSIVTKQEEMSKKVNEGLKEKFQDAKGDKEKFAELFETMQKENAKVRGEIKKLLDAELTADQKKRLKEISVQAMGVGVFGDPDAKGGGGGGFRNFFGPSETQKATMKEVQDTLKLTDTQKSSIKGIMTEYNKDVSDMRKEIFGNKKGGGFDPEKMADFQKKSGKLGKEVMAKIEDLLDDSQKKTWKELTGPTFDVSKLRPIPPKKD